MELNITRAGHYHTPGSGNGSCQEATIVHVNDGPIEGTVNVRAHQHDGEPFSRLDVPVSTPQEGDDARASFHLTRDCPWGR